ncbi:MAG TPA: XrtA system polysaccharide chain length determinant [Rhizomicrobium sp.]|jgi:polysaccharide chain length determinant protein (PEP-CTERM system associated)|nr:XrtA system polysaccharide chain length determinant [Rhizomicrobium sp.]
MAASDNRTESLRTLVLEQAITVWKRKWLVLAVTWLVCIAGWAGVMFVPQRFESDARAFLDVNGILTPLLKGLVVDTSPAESEGYLRQTLLSRPNLDQVIVLANLGGAAMTAVQHEELVSALAGDIKVTTDGNNLVSISYVNRDPRVAKNVVDALLTIFAEKAADSSRAEMDKARAFLNGQIAQYEVQLRTAEQQRAAFRKKYANYFTDSGVARPDVLQQQVVQLGQQYADAVATRNAIAAQMAQVPQLLSVTSAPTVSNSGQIVVASPETRLAQAKRNLADLRLLYTDKHPDVIAAKRSVAELQADVDAEKKTGGTNEGKTQISNPAYEQLRLKLVDAQTILPTLKNRLDTAMSDYNRAKALSGNLPEIEAKSQDIDRDYDVVKANYDELVKRRESANLSQAADDRADRTQFRIVDPPEVPLFPAFPNRAVLFTFATLLGLAAGIAAPLGLAQIHPTFGSPARLRELGLPVIGAVTFVRAARHAGIFARAAGGLFVTGLAGVLLVYGGLLFRVAHITKGMW